MSTLQRSNQVSAPAPFQYVQVLGYEHAFLRNQIKRDQNALLFLLNYAFLKSAR
jgi:hypothetical protein